jgi:putative ABC transport system ATP-binding protein
VSATQEKPHPQRPSAGDVVVAAHDLTRRYGEGETAVDALRGVSLDVRAGELVAVMGPSDSGKSTLMHILAGLDKPTSGTVEIAGTEITTLGDGDLTKLRRKHIGFVFQFFNLLSNMTVADNVELPALLAGATPRQARKRREELLAELGIAGKAGAAPARLSGGEQQRVALARALANEPSVLLADEPTGNLDEDMAGEILGLVKEIWSRGTTVLFATHQARLVPLLKRRTLRLEGGRLVKDEG